MLTESAMTSWEYVYASNPIWSWKSKHTGILSNGIRRCPQTNQTLSSGGNGYRGQYNKGNDPQHIGLKAVECIGGSFE